MTDFSCWLSASSVGLNSHFSTTDLSPYHPTLEQSNQLCKLFFECVNPFIRMLHKGHFGKELNQYRRGAFAFMGEFEALLFSIYALTVHSLHAEVVEAMFSMPKQEITERFKQAAQMAMTKINFHRTDKIIAVQATGHYLVSKLTSTSPRDTLVS